MGKACDNCGEYITFLKNGGGWMPVEYDSVTSGDEQFEPLSGHVRHSCATRDYEEIWQSVEKTADSADRSPCVDVDQAPKPDWSVLIYGSADKGYTSQPVGEPITYENAKRVLVNFLAGEEISVSELSEITGLSLSNISQMIKRGVLPRGVKRNRKRFLPAQEALKIIASQPRPYAQRKKRTRGSVAKSSKENPTQPVVPPSEPDWNSLL